MMGLGTTRGALLRGTTTDDFGDEVDTDDVANGYDDFVVSIIETSRRVQDPDSGMWRAVSKLEARVPTNVPARVGDRLLDKRSGITYTIDDETDIKRGISGFSSRTLRITQTSA